MTEDGARQYLVGLIEAAKPGYTDPNVLIQYPNLPTNIPAGVDKYLRVEIVNISGNQADLNPVCRVRQYSQLWLIAYARKDTGMSVASIMRDYFASAVQRKATTDLKTQTYFLSETRPPEGWFGTAAIVSFDYDRLA